MIALFLIMINFAYASVNFSKIGNIDTFNAQIFKEEISKYLFESDELQDEITIENRKYKIETTIDPELEEYIAKELKRYRSDYTSVVVIDNNNGNILASVDYTRATKKLGRKLGFTATNPAASVFKLVTAAQLLENTTVKGEMPFDFNGRSTTLYKYQLKNQKNKWTRHTNFNKAFAVSNNVVFGKAARNYTTIEELEDMANKFGFNQSITQSLLLETSNLFSAKNDYNLAELASGFNKKTQISPLHGALFSSVVANDGHMKMPTITKQVTDKITGKLVWEPSAETKTVISEHTAKELSYMMELTVNKGTARGAFRKMKRSLKEKLIIGGKTGSITGGEPFGKRDWFVSYARPKEGKDKGISIAVMIVNVKKWYIKSPYLAKNIIQYYYKSLRKIDKQ